MFALGHGVVEDLDTISTHVESLRSPIRAKARDGRLGNVCLAPTSSNS
jgi:hypothetical protein